MTRWRPEEERGQVLVIMATAMFFVLLGVAAVTVDLGNGFLQKRRLQNVADAAALAAAQDISRGGDAAHAISVAQAIVTNNTGGSVTLPGAPVGGTGVNLTEGIEITGAKVRVGLVNRNVQAFFSGVFGFNSLTASARARAEVNTAGIVPIAVKRYSAGQTMWQLCASGQPNDPPNSPVCSAVDYMNAANQVVGTTISAWPAPWPALLTQSALVPASSTLKGPVIPIIGSAAHPNPSQDHPSFNFFVAPDLRNVTGVVEGYNGVTSGTSANTLKLLEADYFLPTNMGYSSAPVPDVGDQLAILDGVITGMAVSRMKETYPPGSTVTAMVYDGTVHRTPDFKLILNKDVDDTSPYEYTVTLRQLSSPPLYAPWGVQFTVEGINETDFATWTFNGSSSVYTQAVNGTDVSVTLRFQPVGGTPPPSGIRTFTVKAYDLYSMTTRTVTGALVLGTGQSGFFARSDDSGAQPSTFKRLGRGTWDTYQFYIHSYYHTGPNIWINTGGIRWAPVTGGSWGSAPFGVSVAQEGNNANPHGTNSEGIRLRVDVAANAATGEWLVEVPVTNGYSSQDQYIYFVLRVLTDTSGYAANADYVHVLGYANFELCYADGSFNHPTSADNNTVWGRVVSDLVPDPTPLLLARGRQVRLVGWGQ